MLRFVGEKVCATDVDEVEALLQLYHKVPFQELHQASATRSRHFPRGNRLDVCWSCEACIRHINIRAAVWPLCILFLLHAKEPYDPR